LQTITFDEFIAWYKTRHYGQGDVITTGDGAVCLITGFVGGESVSEARLTSSGALSTEPVVVSRDSGGRKSSVQEKKALQRAMNGAGLIWNPYRKRLRPNIRTQKKHYVTLWVIDEPVGMGIYKEIDADGNIVLYCYTDRKGSLDFGGNYVFGPAADYAVREAGTAERFEITEQLNKLQLYWHGRLKRFEPLNLRRPSGSTYYYIESGGRVMSSVENGRNVDMNRFKFGNYFHTKEEAEAFKRHIVLQRSDLLVGRLTLDAEPAE
jgi:hypothetical protein